MSVASPSIQERITFSWRNVSYCKFYYENQYGNQRATEPDTPTLYGRSSGLLDNIAGTDETVLERAIKRGSIDIWKPKCRVQLSNNHSLLFVGERAINIWKEHNAREFGKKKKV